MNTATLETRYEVYTNQYVACKKAIEDLAPKSKIRREMEKELATVSSLNVIGRIPTDEEKALKVFEMLLETALKSRREKIAKMMKRLTDAAEENIGSLAYTLEWQVEGLLEASVEIRYYMQMQERYTEEMTYENARQTLDKMKAAAMQELSYKAGASTSTSAIANEKTRVEAGVAAKLVSRGFEVHLPEVGSEGSFRFAEERIEELIEASAKLLERLSSLVK